MKFTSLYLYYTTFCNKSQDISSKTALYLQRTRKFL